MGMAGSVFAQVQTRAAFNALSGRFLPLWLAAEAGHFKKQGLSVPLVYVRGPLAVPALAAGEIDFALMGGSTALAGITKGLDLVLIASIMSRPDLVIVTRKGIREPKQLRGLRIGVGRFGGEPDFLLRYALNRWGHTPNQDVTILQLFGSHPQRMAAVVHGRVDAAVITPPTSFKAQQVGLDQIPLDEPSENYLGVSLVTRRDLIEKNRSLVQRFTNAFVGGLQKAKSDKAAGVAMLRKYIGLQDAEVLGRSFDTYAGLLNDNPVVNPAAVALMQSMMGKQADIRRNYTNQFINSAN